MASISDFRFAFDDDLDDKVKVGRNGRKRKIHDGKGKQLKREFVKRWNEVEQTVVREGTIPAFRSSISWADAKSFVSGALYQRTQKFMERYTVKDYNKTENGFKHKYNMIDYVQKGSTSFRKYLKNINKLFSMVDEETSRFSGDIVRYHRVYYGMLKGGLRLPSG